LSWSFLSFQSTSPPFMSSRTIAQARSKSATFIGCRPT
jgi:hypothetical protein